MRELIFTKPKDEKNNEQSEHQEALRHFEAHRDIFEHYARGKANVKPAPAGLDTFAFNLETDDIYLNSRFYQQKGLSDEKTTFATLHEIEHFLEKKALLAEKNGEQTFSRYLVRIESSEAYRIMDNCLADIRENTAVVDKTDKSYANLEQSIYKEDFFPDADLSNEPKHLQLSQAMLRESRVPEEQCKVSSEVRDVINQLQAIRAEDGTSLLEIIAHPSTPMSVRLKLQDKYIWPKVEALLKKDQKEQKKQSGEQGDKKQNPNKTFEDAYARADKRVPNAVPTVKEKEAFKKWQETHGNLLDRADQEYAKTLGVEKEDLQKYRLLADQMRNIINPETNQSIIDDLRELIARIIARRKKEIPAPRYPVEEGEDLVDPVELIARTKAHDFEPKAWETYDIRMQKGQRFGTVEITLVCDRSTSMRGQKMTEQQKAAVLFMEALKEFSDIAQEESFTLEKPLEVKSEVYAFQSSSDDARPLKVLSDDFSEKERIKVTAKIGTLSGSTTDFVPLETIVQSLNEEKIKLLAEGEIKKIVIVFTDGESDDSARVRQALENLRSKGVIVIGIGITEDGRLALDTYAPEARLAETAEKLPSLLADVLSEHLADV